MRMGMEAEVETERNKEQLTVLPPSTTHSRWIGEQLTVLAEALEIVLTPTRLKIYAKALADIEKPRLAQAFDRALLECKFFPKIAELREWAGVDPEMLADGEMRAAWEVLVNFVRKYVGNDVFGNFGPEHGWYNNFPKLPQRILDTVLRTGGWRVYKCLTDDDFPFQQKRFFDTYRGWTNISCALPHLLPSTVELLPPGQPEPAAEGAPKISTPTEREVKAKGAEHRIPVDHSAEEWKRRRDEAKAQIGAIIRQRRAYAGGESGGCERTK